jgi:hypothetical protein
MTLKKLPFYLPLMLVLMICAGCGAAASPSNSTSGQPQMFRPRTGGTTSQRALGDVVVSSGLDENGCAIDSVTSFDNNDPVYVILQSSTFPAGTRLFARLYQDNQAVEDTDELVADQAYSNVCVNFVFEPSARAEVWDTGNYGVEFYVDGNSYGSVDFEIR